MEDATTISNAKRIKSYRELNPGDYVVHADHGIGKYLGVRTIKVDGEHRDYLSIAYRNNAKIYVPITKLDLIQKYVSAGQRHPVLSSLGSDRWRKTKNRVSHKVEDIAGNLVDLYAKRSHEKGYAFPKDDATQREFDDSFPYKLTPDQARSTREIKLDMEKPHPMDRLLVGDVGYGKTEVALRAAFKAIEGGKQVAILVPTTILAVQHCENMLKRFGDYPISIGILSRFSTREQTQDTIRSLKQGWLNIVVGTHRMLSKDVQFADLGLLIVDEEQRFGVKDKDIIKKRNPRTDALTLTATPIPRTLNMAMMGVCDLSIIETPPVDRKPIQTRVVPETKTVIRNGIRREMKRNGQVFFLHNRVDDIDETAVRIHDLVPEARVAHIDGAMDKNDMEHILMDFVDRKYDVLVTTTIIETGIDIANANTLFIENSNDFGLSQLYQLRGRVGRSGRQAYAYLMYKPHRVLNETSTKRLDAMRKFNDLGSGFKIAMRDLTIRGSGTLLGSQQHGFINSVGYDMYTHMLSNAVAKKQGKTVANFSISDIHLGGMDAYLPKDYVSDQGEKVSIYRRLNEITNLDQLKAIENQLLNDYGRLPQPVDNLLLAAKIRLSTRKAHIAKVSQYHLFPNRITVTLSKTGTERYNRTLIRKILPNDVKPVFKNIHNRLSFDLNLERPTKDDLSWVGIIMDTADELAEQR